MFVIENFGDWIINTRKGLVFGLIVFAAFVLVLFKMGFGSVTLLNAREFECAMAVPDGLGTKCIEYHIRRK